MCWQSDGLTFDGPQRHGELGCSSGEARFLCSLHISLLAGEEGDGISRLELPTLNAAACHRQYQMRESERPTIGILAFSR